MTQQKRLEKIFKKYFPNVDDIKVIDFAEEILRKKGDMTFAALNRKISHVYEENQPQTPHDLYRGIESALDYLVSARS